MLNHLTVTAPKGRHPWTDCTRVDYQLCPKYEDLVATSGRTVPCHHWPIMSFYSSAGLHYFYAPIINVNCTLLFHDVPRWCCGLSVSRAKLVAELKMKFHQRNRSASTIRFVLMISGRVLRVLLCCTVWEMWEVFGNSCPSSLPLFFSLLLLGFHFSPSQVQVVEVVLNMIQSILVSLTLFIQHRYMIWSCRINTKGYLRMLQLCNPILHLCFSGQFTYTHPQNSLKTNLASLQSCAVS